MNDKFKLILTQATTDISPYRDEPSGSQSVIGNTKQGNSEKTLYLYHK